MAQCRAGHSSVREHSQCWQDISKGAIRSRCMWGGRRAVYVLSSSHLLSLTGLADDSPNFLGGFTGSFQVARALGTSEVKAGQ